ncbi:MAG: hypothetical protein LBB43_05065 [Spirochaetaceae bacterium]|jgi:hypothetical protein|nr:hypothetical protein [Spirochaetaceae bacterium]
MKQRRVILGACLLLLLCVESSAQTVSIEAEEWAYQYAPLGRAAALSWEDFARLSLYVSGANLSTPEGRRYEEALFRAVNQFLSMKDMPADITQRGEYILSYLYKTLLKSYSERQTRVDIAVGSGDYNCVSSAVLYSIFARAAGLDVRAVVTQDHAFVTLNAGSAASPKLIDVETTSEYGFNPGSKKEFLDSFGRTGFVYSEPGNYKDRAAISSFELASLILTNRISELGTRVFETLPLAANRAVLLSQRTSPVDSPLFVDSQGDFYDRILYAANTLGKNGQTAQMFQWTNRAFDIARQMLSVSPTDARWEERAYVALDTLLSLLLNNQQAAQARQTLLAYRNFVNRSHYAALDAKVLDGERWLVERDLIQKLNAVRTLHDAEAALLAINEAATVLAPSRIAELRNSFLVQEANLVMQEKGLHEAIIFAESVLAQYGRNTVLERNLQAYRSNRVAELHNRFADLWNSGNRSGAYAFIQDALREFPDNRQLQQDKSIVDQYR